MARTEFEQVLYNWISEANSPIGSFSNDTDRAAWVARNFLEWWHPRIKELVLSIEGSGMRLQELFKELDISIETEAGDEAFHELESIGDDARELRAAFDIPEA